MLEQIRLLDERLYTYCDDTDICLRANRAGWETWFVPQSWVIHYVGASPGVRVEGKQSRLPAYWFQARRGYFLKDFGRWYTMLVDATFPDRHSASTMRLQLRYSLRSKTG